MFRKLLFFAALNLIVFTSAFSQSSTSTKYFGEASTGVAPISSAVSNLYSPSFSLGFGLKKKVHSNIYFDVGVNYSNLNLLTQLDFVNPFGSIQQRISLHTLQLAGKVGAQFSNVYFGIGLGTYHTLNSNFILEDTSGLEIKGTGNEFLGLLLDGNYNDIGLTAPIELGVRISESLDIKLGLNFLFIEGITPLNADGRRYLSIKNYTLGVRKYI